MQKKLLLFLVSLLWGVGTAVADVTAGKFLINTNSDGTCEINGLSTSEKKVCKAATSGYKLVIPSTITYSGTSYKVSGIADNAFNPSSVSGDYSDVYCNIDTVDLSNALYLKEIGSYAFCGYSGTPKSKLVAIVFLKPKTLFGVTLGLTVIKDHAFKNCVNLTSATFPSSITEIGDYAFENTGLTSVTINSNISFGGNVFYDSKNLAYVTVKNNAIASKNYGTSNKNFADWFPYLSTLTFGGNVTSIGSYVCYRSSGDCKINNLNCGPATSIGTKAFINCKKLKNIKFDSVQTVNDDAFSGCTELERVDFSTSNVTKLVNRVFQNCTSLYDIELGNISSVGDKCFDGCSSLTVIDLKNLSSDAAFAGCANLSTLIVSTNKTKDIHYTPATTLKFASSLNTFDKALLSADGQTIEYVTFENTNGFNIPEAAFKNCPIVTVTGRILSVGSQAFYQRTALTTVNLLYATSIDASAFLGCTALKAVKLQRVKTIGSSAFYGCSALKKLGTTSLSTCTLNYLTSIGDEAFKGTLLTYDNLSLPKCTTIGKSAFEGLTRLNGVSVNNAKTIGASAFKGCTGMDSLQVGGSVDVTSFSGCTALKTVDIYSAEIANPSTKYTINSNISKYFGNQVENYSFRTTTIGEHALDAILNSGIQKNLKTVTIGGSVREIGAYAFDMCTNLATVTFDQKDGEFVSIGEAAFSGCNALQAVDGNIRSIGKTCFNACSALKKANLKFFSGAIPDYAFSSCKVLEMVGVESDSVTSIGKNAFSYCTAFTGDLPSSSLSLYLPNVQTVSASAFRECTSLSYNPCYKASKIDDDAFYGCRKLKYLTYDNVKSIGKRAFYNCTSLSKPAGEKYFTLPSTLEEVGDQAFGGTYIHDVKLEGNNIVTLGANVFDGIHDLYLDCPALLEKKTYTATDNLLVSFPFDASSSNNKLSFGPSVKTIYYYAFYNNNSNNVKIRNIDFESNVSSLAPNGFKGIDCENFIMRGTALLEPDEININCSNVYIYNQECLNRSYQKDANMFTMFGTGLNTVNLMFANRKANIPDNLFYTEVETGLQSVGGAYLIKVGKSAFYGNKKLESVLLDSVTTIGDNAFEGCDGFEILEISNDNESKEVYIGHQAFKGTSLEIIGVHRGKIADGKRSDATCNKITIESDAFEGQKPWFLIDMSDQVNVECTPFSKVITNTEEKADEYRNKPAASRPTYVTSIQRMECYPEDVNMDGKFNGQDALKIYDFMMNH